MNEKVSIPCPLCGSLQHTVKYKPSKMVTDPALLYGAASGVVGTQTIVTCDGCGFIFENPRYPEDVILKGYDSANEAGHDSQYDMRVESFYRALKKHAALLPKPGARVLDVGTAGGAFLVAAKKFGYDVVGLEPCLYLVEAGKKRGFNIEHGVLQATPFPSGHFDMICFWDVLEHVTDPVKELKSTHALLKDNGVLLVNYPDIGTIPAKLAGEKFWWLLSVHLVHFDPASLTKACRLAGFEPFSWRMYWQTLQFGYLLKMGTVFFPRLGAFIERCVPSFLKSLNMSYYASQTTCLARKVK